MAVRSTGVAFTSGAPQGDVSTVRGEVRSFHITEDGAEAQLVVRTNDDKSVGLAFPSRELDRLLPVIAHAAAAAMRSRLEDESVKRLLPLDRWEIRRHPEGGAILSFFMPGDIEVAFGLDDGVVRLLRNALHEIVLKSLEPASAPPRSRPN